MDFPEGGKIDTVVYSAATGALSSTARAGNGAASVVRPAMEIITRRNMRIVPNPPDCCCLPANRYPEHQRQPRIRQKLSPRYCDAKTVSMIGHRNLGQVMAPPAWGRAVASGRQHRSNVPEKPSIATT